MTVASCRMEQVSPTFGRWPAVFAEHCDAYAGNSPSLGYAPLPPIDHVHKDASFESAPHHFRLTCRELSNARIRTLGGVSQRQALLRGVDDEGDSESRLARRIGMRLSVAATNDPRRVRRHAQIEKQAGVGPPAATRGDAEQRASDPHYREYRECRHDRVCRHPSRESW
jgi:hypothetical protein